MNNPNIIEFEIEGDYIELFKLLKATNVCASGGEAKMLIEEGEVFVDGVVETRKRRKITSRNEIRLFDFNIRILTRGG